MGFLIQGLAGNLSELSKDEILKDYSSYLMAEENVQTGFRLIRDMVIFTDRRILDMDRQGMTGQKMRINTIYLDSIVNVSMETAGFGIDDSELSVTYITNPYFRSNAGTTLEVKTFEFPKSFKIQKLYKWLSEIAYNNHLRINK